MNDYLKRYIKENLALIDEEMYDDLYRYCNKADRSKLTKFLLSCDIRPDEHMTSLPEYYLAGSNIHSYHISSTIHSIEARAFYGCSELKNIHIPDSVTSTGDYAFYGCTSLTSVYITDIEAWLNISFEGSTSTSTPCCYGADLYWNDEKLTTLVIPDSVTSISSYAFYGCHSLESITIPEGVTSIDDWAFGCCSNLTRITISSSVTSLGVAAFYNCDRLNTICYKGTVEEWKQINIAPWSFDNVLTSFVICTDGVTRTQ